jgi:hypothetical protein
MTPEQAIRDWLRRMGDSASEPARSAPSGSGPTRPTPPVMSSIEIVKRRAIPGRQVVALHYRDTVEQRSTISRWSKDPNARRWPRWSSR